MEIDYNFTEQMFRKYSKHLQDVVTSIETLIGGYDRQLNELNRLCETEEGRKKYDWRRRELEEKKAEAFKKLANVSPNIEKMANQIQVIQEKINADAGIN